MFKLLSITAKQFLQLLCCLLLCNSTFAQTNLVPNPSFEQYTTCPDYSTDASTRNSKPDIWYKPDARGAGYFNACSNGSSLGGVPVQNTVVGQGYQFARTGNSYIGMYYLHGNSNNYFQVKLLDSLKPNRYYYAECYLNLFNFSNWASNNQGILLTKKAVYVDTANYTFMLANAQVENKYIIKDTVNWVKVSGTFKATGGEQYLTLGNFKLANASQKITIQTTGNYAAAYYVDDVAVYALDSFCLKADAGKDITIQQGDSAFIGSYTNGIDSLLWLENGTTKTDSTRPGFYVSPQSTTYYVLHQIVNGCFSSDTVYVTVNTLPLKFINYQVTLSNNQIINNWQTVNEINVSHFNIQRSINGKDFIPIGKLTAKSNTYNEYDYLDMQPLFGDSYYRIQSIDKDGKANYTEIKKISINDKQQTISIYPNPATTTVNITSQQNIQQIKLINQLGQTLQQFINLNTKHQTINIEQFAKGVYIIQITTSNGEIKTQKIVKE